MENEVSVSEQVAREREQMEQALMADPAFVWAMQSVEGRKSLDAPATMRALQEVRKFLLEQSGYVLGLVEAAEGHLSELHGPAFAAWRCDECGNLITDRVVARIVEHNRGYDEMGAVATVPQVRVVLTDGEALYVRCIVGDHGQSMRHVLCRVTADSPEADRGA